MNQENLSLLDLFKLYDEYNYYLCTALAYLKDRDIDNATKYYNLYRKLFPVHVSNMAFIEQHHMDIITDQWKCDTFSFCHWIRANNVIITIIKEDVTPESAFHAPAYGLVFKELDTRTYKITGVVRDIKLWAKDWLFGRKSQL